MGPIRDPNVAIAAVVFGLLIGYIELLKPGLVVAGAVGLVLVMLGLRRSVPSRSTRRPCF